jgi:oligopeptide transport system ATP-binding protein
MRCCACTGTAARALSGRHGRASSATSSGSTTGIQAQILNLLADIREQTGVSYILISHDLAVVRQITDEAIVMHRGRVVERGRTADVLDAPRDPYTQRLRASVPRPGWKPRRRPRIDDQGALPA